MTTQYGRIVKLLVSPRDGNEALDLSQCEFNFYIQRGDTQTPNTAKIRVYGLQAATMHRLDNSPTSEFTRVVLQCGYRGLDGETPTIGSIFEGNIKYTRRGFEENQANPYVDIVGGDGDSAYNFAVVNTTLAAGATPDDHIDAVVGAMGAVKPDGVTKGYIPPMTGTLPRGKPLFGMARDVMRDLARNQYATWSIQDGQLQLLPANGALPDEAIELNSGTGLVDFPQQTVNGLQVKALINPAIKIGSLIKIDNAKIQKFAYSLNTGATGVNALLAQTSLKTDADGVYRVLWTEHTGGTRQNEWYTDMICVAKDISQGLATLTKTGPIALDELVNIPQ